MDASKPTYLLYSCLESDVEGACVWSVWLSAVDGRSWALRIERGVWEVDTHAQSQPECDLLPSFTAGRQVVDFVESTCITKRSTIPVCRLWQVMLESLAKVEPRLAEEVTGCLSTRQNGRLDEPAQQPPSDVQGQPWLVIQ